MSMASEKSASTAVVPELNDLTWTSADGSSTDSGPPSASATRPGAWVMFGKTPMRTAPTYGNGPGRVAALPLGATLGAEALPDGAVLGVPALEAAEGLLPDPLLQAAAT